jgi:hypothetical protein
LNQVDCAMKWSLVTSGLAGAGMLALGSDLVVPIGAMMGSLCDLAGVAAAMVFFGLADGA